MAERVALELRVQTGRGKKNTRFEYILVWKKSEDVKVSRNLWSRHTQHIRLGSLEIIWSYFVTVQYYWNLEK